LVDRIRERYPQTFAYFTDNDCPAEAILNVASKLNADMIIISAHDKGWIAKLLLYSDADDIARRSRTPVLVYPAKIESENKIAPPDCTQNEVRIEVRRSLGASCCELSSASVENLRRRLEMLSFVFLRISEAN
jgi:hypothetical protein